ncbi:MAG: PGF-pre-PGF domain-containing protein, partial [Candidatus Aenigmatarchaeota archaeon]
FSDNCTDSGDDGICDSNYTIDSNNTDFLPLVSPPPPPPCIENWVYGEWGSCIGGQQTRSANDLNSCGTFISRSEITRSCLSESSGAIIKQPEEEEEPETVTGHFEKIEPGEVANMTVEDEETSIKEINIEVKNPVKDIDVKVLKLPEKPAEVAHEVVGKVYEYLELNLTNVTDTDIEKATIGFRVSKMWLIENKINKTTVRLNRYFNGNWHEMPTILIGESPGFVYYEAEVPGFSIFAITGEEVKETICTPDEKRCTDNNLEMCSEDGTGWSVLETCENGCGDETLSCNPPPSEVDISTYIFFAVSVIVIAAIVLYIVKKGKPKSVS